MNFRFSRFDRYVPAVVAVTPHEDTMTTDRIESFLRHSGFGVEALEEVRPDLPRWLRYLKERGVTYIPTSPVTSGPYPHAANLISQQGLQASRRDDPFAKRMAHHLRNLTETRPYKP